MPRTSDAEKRRTLLDDVVRSVLDTGLATLSLRPLAGQVGTSARMLVYYFGSKDGLVSAVLEQTRARQVALLSLDGECDPQAALERSWKRITAPAAAKDVRLMLEVAALSAYDPARYGDTARATTRDWTRSVAGVLERAGMARGSAGETAAVLTAGMRGLLSEAITTGDKRRSTQGFNALLAAVAPVWSKAKRR